MEPTITALSMAPALPQTQPAAVEMQGVWKRFGQQVAVQDLSLRIPQGEVFALLGPNGAGKSTTIRMLTSLTRPSQGSIRVGGYDVVRDPLAVRRQIGVVLQPITLEAELTVWENLEFHGRMHHIPNPDRQRRIDEWLEYVKLADRRQDKVKTLSGGMKRRLQVARALLHRPQILFLDEPTVGLDPQARRLLWEILRDLNRQGMTLLITTHYMEEAEELCDRIGIMDGGKLIELGSTDQLRAKYGEALLVCSRPGQEVSYTFFPSLAEAQRQLEAEPDKTGLMVRPANLEDIFVRLTGRRLD
ncbi:ABC transporter ATP-binding protein [Synechococcus sp. OH20]|uniref:ABC transporter ATP-binding protein n=1 Tax=unclassified Synechococcus TaxID=2626047 RepID=UPI0039C5B778